MTNSLIFDMAREEGVCRREREGHSRGVFGTGWEARQKRRKKKQGVGSLERVRATRRARTPGSEGDGAS